MGDHFASHSGFEDLIQIEDEGFAILAGAVDLKQLAMALAPVSEAMLEKFMKNMTPEQVLLLNEQMGELGSMAATQVATAQRRIHAIARELEDHGKLRMRSLFGEPPSEEESKILISFFECIPKLTDASLPLLVQAVPRKHLLIALKTATDEIRDQIAKGMSRMTGERFFDDLGVMGPVRLSEIEAAQREVGSHIRRLLEEKAIGLRS
jgi:flagellar motor switch protein FliG